MFLERLENKTIQKIIWWGIFLFGAFFRLRQYFVNRSLWVDEASLALNIVSRSFRELTHPLDHSQGAPIGFLFIEKAFVLIFGNHELILRLFPLISGLLAMYLMMRIAIEYFGNYGLIAFFQFALSSSMIYYSSEVKQYSTDVFIFLLLLYLALYFKFHEITPYKAIWLGMVGFLALWLSHPSAFLLAVVGLVLLIDRLVSKSYRQIPWLFVSGIIWGLSFLVLYLISLRHLVGNDVLQNYWSDFYAPFPPWKNLVWYKNMFFSVVPGIDSSFLNDIFPSFKYEYLYAAFFGLVLLGVLSLSIKDAYSAGLFVMPLMVAFLASFINKYPLYERFLYFWIPALLFLFAEGVRQLFLRLSRLHSGAAVTGYALLALIFLWSPMKNAFYVAEFPVMGEDIKPVLNYMSDHLQEGDEIYAHYGGINSFLYYLPFYEFNVENVFIPGKSRDIDRFIVDVIGYSEERSNRVWFVFTHIINCDCNEIGRAGRLQAHIDILDTYGTQMDHFAAFNADAYLYSFGE